MEEDVEFNEGAVWKLGEGEGASFLVSEDATLVEESHEAKKPVSKMIPGDGFKSIPAFVFLEQIHLTQLPNVPGTGIGIHNTTNTWQVRYPAGTQSSCGRTFGETKKGFVPPVKALLECLLWAWQQHFKANPSCSVSQERIQIISGALSVNLGSHLV